MSRLSRAPGAGARPALLSLAGLLALALSLGGCGGESTGGARGGEGPAHGAGAHGPDPPRAAAAVPVEVAPVLRRSISTYIETNGTLEAENEVDIVARTSAPVVELLTEEGHEVRRGEVLARLDAQEHRARLEISRVARSETETTWKRARSLYEEDLISVEEYERALAAYESARAQFDENEIQLGYTEIRAPFDGLIVARYVHLAENVALNAPLFRISDFDPLLCPIQVPEREMPRLRVGQSAYLTVEAWPGRRFSARVLRIRPVVDADTGTIRVTLEVRTEGRLRPGMFARVFVETATRDGALVIPKAALSLESIGDTVYVAKDGRASRREVSLGYQEGDFVEILSGVAEGESVVVVGQDGLGDGTPIQILSAAGGPREAPAAGPSPSAPPGGRRLDFSEMTPEQLERAKQRMRERGLTEEQIEERIRRARGMGE